MDFGGDHRSPRLATLRARDPRGGRRLRSYAIIQRDRALRRPPAVWTDRIAIPPGLLRHQKRSRRQGPGFADAVGRLRCRPATEMLFQHHPRRSEDAASVSFGGSGSWRVAWTETTPRDLDEERSPPVATPSGAAARRPVRAVAIRRPAPQARGSDRPGRPRSLKTPSSATG